MLKAPYVVGIDLGTSNSALSYWKRGGDSTEIKVLEVPQIEAPGRLSTRKTMPSVTYLPHDGELRDKEVKLPWQSKGRPEAVIGEWARERGGQVPDRLISSAKSWLCYQQVDRKAAILPWQSTVDGKTSPLTALASYLEHLRQAFEHERREAGEAELDWAKVDVVLTVPASFDEVARNLTVEAATAAGLRKVTLLEEPQAAFYSWIAHNEKKWREQVTAGDVVLVCDVGGGTTDFSLIAVNDAEGQLSLERVSVGDHLLLGGDNMDLALAYALKAKLQKEGTSIDRWQLLGLVNAARVAKEQLLSDPSLAEAPIAIAGKGSSLFAQTISTALSQAELSSVVLAGFFPLSGIDDLPKPRLGTGIQEFGLPYESEPAISRHLARFLKRSRQNIESNPKLKALVATCLQQNGCADKDYLIPSAILFNGGVFNSPLLREQVRALLAQWAGGAALKEITGIHLDLAVAHGATYFGRSKLTGEGIRIAAGTARSYYLGLETAMLAVPGIEPEVKGLCVVPQGTEEGVHLNLPAKQFGLVTGQPAQFRFFSSAVRAGDTMGALVDDASQELEETASLSVTLPPLAEGREGEMVPVFLDACVTEVGTLQLYMKHAHSEQKWNVEFNVRPRFDSLEA